MYGICQTEGQLILIERQTRVNRRERQLLAWTKGKTGWTSSVPPSVARLPVFKTNLMRTRGSQLTRDYGGEGD